MLEALEGANITTITIKKDAVKWIRQGREIEINGKLFDVRNFSKAGEYYTVNGLYDEKEALLVAALKKVQQHTQNENPVQHGFIKIATTVLFFENIKDFNFLLPANKNIKFGISARNNFFSFYPELTSPPPKV